MQLGMKREDKPIETDNQTHFRDTESTNYDQEKNRETPPKELTNARGKSREPTIILVEQAGLMRYTGYEGTQ
ncbi:hypothetical protein ANO14919_021080 [Xylariales sp. No.14919]|nr:hypothetical protein ANO14919_021080 [Xylariales sp. No.14919]